MGYWIQRAKHLREDKAQEPDSALMQPGAMVTWISGDRKVNGPYSVDFIHTDDDGSTWLYVSGSDYQAAVNLKFVTVVS